MDEALQKRVLLLARRSCVSAWSHKLLIHTLFCCLTSDQAWTMIHSYVSWKAVMCFLIESPQENQDIMMKWIIARNKKEMGLYGDELGP